MPEQFSEAERMLDYVRGRLEGLAHTVRFPMPEEIKQELLQVTQMLAKPLTDIDKQRYEDMHR